MEYFKGDELERKFVESGRPILDLLSTQKKLFFDGSYQTAALGEMIYDTSRAPLANAIERNIFREAFKEIFDAFVVAGTFESYLTVFRRIFGNDVIVDFTIPGPGRLVIDIEAAGIELSDLLARYIESNAYVFDEIIDDEGDTIVTQTIKGFQSQYELEQMLFEMVPAGIQTEISLTIGAP